MQLCCPLANRYEINIFFSTTYDSAASRRLSKLSNVTSAIASLRAAYKSQQSAIVIWEKVAIGDQLPQQMHKYTLHDRPPSHVSK